MSSPHLLRKNCDDAAVTNPPSSQLFRNVVEEITCQSESICSKYVRQGLALFGFISGDTRFARKVCDTPQLPNSRPTSKTSGNARIGCAKGGSVITDEQ